MESSRIWRPNIYWSWCKNDMDTCCWTQEQASIYMIRMHAFGLRHSRCCRWFQCNHAVLLVWNIPLYNLTGVLWHNEISFINKTVYLHYMHPIPTPIWCNKYWNLIRTISWFLTVNMTILLSRSHLTSRMETSNTYISLQIRPMWIMGWGLITIRQWVSTGYILRPKSGCTKVVWTSGIIYMDNPKVW